MIEQQEFLISSFPGIGVTHARNLLTHFGSVKKIVNASLSDLQEVDKIGEKMSSRLISLFEEEYVKGK